jgi:hypothetical protein
MNVFERFESRLEKMLWKILKRAEEQRNWDIPIYGRKGFRVVEFGTVLPVEEKYGALLVIADANIDLSPNTGDSDTGVEIKAGTVIPVPFDNTGLTVNSGTVYAFIES